MTDKQQPEALRLANVCSNLTRYSMDAHLIAAYLRSQHTEIETLREKLKTYEDLGNAQTPRARPIFSKMDPSLIEELVAHGYDLTTLKFSIREKAPIKTNPTPPTPQTSKKTSLHPCAPCEFAQCVQGYVHACVKPEQLEKLRRFHYAELRPESCGQDRVQRTSPTRSKP